MGNENGDAFKVLTDAEVAKIKKEIVLGREVMREIRGLGKSIVRNPGLSTQRH